MPSALLEFNVAVQALVSGAVVLVLLIVGLLEERRDRARWRQALAEIDASAPAPIEIDAEPASAGAAVPPAQVA
jgi:hypothetical protein